jgi:hypothetical protein
MRQGAVFHVKHRPLAFSGTDPGVIFHVKHDPTRPAL